MTILKLVIYTIILTISVSVSSCAILGTRFKSYDKKNINSIKNIALQINFKDESYRNQIDSAFVSNIETELRKIFNAKITYVGKTSDFPANEDSSVVINSYDAVFECNINPYLMSTFTEPYRYNATARTALVNSNQKTIIAKSKFNTNYGKSYWRHPILKIALYDAVIGAIKPYRKLFK